jgi:hypothetical protein
VGALHDPVPLLRRANQLVRDRAGSLGVEGTVPFICECRDTGCLGRVEMTLDEYDAISAHPGRAAIAPGHEDPAEEQVVERTSRFAVVEREVQAASSRRSFKQ